MLERSLEQRFWAKVDADVEDDCWLWRGGHSDGYGMFWVPEAARPFLAHRVAYEWLVEPIPEGLQLDHLCRVRDCVNPEHLELVTSRENTLRSPIARAAVNARKTHCPRGHAYDEVNTCHRKNGQRACRACRRIRYHEVKRRG